MRQTGISGRNPYCGLLLEPPSSDSIGVPDAERVRSKLPMFLSTLGESVAEYLYVFTVHWLRIIAERRCVGSSRLERQPQHYSVRSYAVNDGR